MNYKSVVFLITLLIVVVGCKEDVLPKPKAQLRLDYTTSESKTHENNLYKFDYNGLARIKDLRGNSLTIDYPEMKGAIFITYKKVEGNLRGLARDAERLSYEHVAKASGIETDVYENPNSKVYGRLYEIIGNAASQSQFYATDSLNHFLTGSVYFYTKPNYDSIYPAAAYLQNDIRSIMESLRWKN